MRAKVIDFSVDGTLNCEYWVLCVGGKQDVSYTTHDKEIKDLTICPCTKDHKLYVIDLPDEVIEKVKEYRKNQK